MTYPEIPRPEHPRPDFMRDPWISLNGYWRFTLDPENLGEQQRWYRRPHPEVSGAPSYHDPFGAAILVPFPWESDLSGVRATDYKGAAWYQRTIVVPADWAADGVGEAAEAVALPLTGGDGTIPSAPGGLRPACWRLRPFLCFGAVDWNAKVWIDGRFVTEHDGGYTPFSLDLSRYLRPGRPATLTVRAWDVCAADTLLGKQTYDWYTHSGGIWQPVWLEGRPGAHLTAFCITPHLREGSATFAVEIAADEASTGVYRLEVRSVEGAFPAVEVPIEVGPRGAQHELQIRIPEPRAWSPEDPHLYECTVSLIDEQGGARSAGSARSAGPEDRVYTYFGLRSISRGRVQEDQEHECVFLNDEPIYLRGVLDQAFHPQGLHAYPSEAAIRADVQAAKDFGFNMLRCHIKVNDPRYYYWADRLGLLVMYDFPSPSIYTPAARANWERTLREAIARDASHPSVFSWILFNETWGLEEHQTAAGWRWIAEMVELARSLDPTRLVEDNSACLFDHVVTDLNTWHFYITSYDRARREIERVVRETYPGSAFNYVSRYRHVEGAEAHRQETAPLLNSEYGGLGARWGDKDISYSFKFLTTELRRHAKICGYVYTELADIEWEHNGLLNYDRTAKEFGYDRFVPGMSVPDLTGADFIGLDCPPCQTLPPGSRFAAPAFVAHWDTRPLEGARLLWELTLTDRFGQERAISTGEREVSARRYSVAGAGAIAVQLPEEPGLITVALWLLDGSGSIRARNYVNVDLYGGPLPAVERTGNGVALRFLPADFTDSSWPQPALSPQGAKFGGMGAGWVEYALPTPEAIDPARLRGLRLIFEAGARTAANRLGWRDFRHRAVGSYPQTESRKLGTHLEVSVNGISLGAVDLPDDPADARGILSLHLSQNFEVASYGFLTTLQADAETTRRILQAGPELRVRFEVPRGGPAGGLNLYGRRMGAYPLEPTLVVELG